MRSVAGFERFLATSRPTVDAVFSLCARRRDSTALCARSRGREWRPGFVADERLREKEFGILDRLTKFGIRERFPELAEQRAHVGKFYFRPPGGESWCDVILRLRSLLDTIVREYRRERVLVVSHQVIVNCMRYLARTPGRGSDPRDRSRRAMSPTARSRRTSSTRAHGRHGKLVPKLVNFVAPLDDAGAAVTSAPDVPAAPKS